MKYGNCCRVRTRQNGPVRWRNEVIKFDPTTPIGGERNRERRAELASRRDTLTFEFLRSLARPRVRELSRFTFRVLFPWRFRFFRLVLFLTCGRQPPWSFLCIVFSSVCGGRQPPYSVCSFVSVLRGRQPPYQFFVQLKFVLVWSFNRITFLFSKPPVDVIHFIRVCNWQHSGALTGKSSLGSAAITHLVIHQENPRRISLSSTISLRPVFPDIRRSADRVYPVFHIWFHSSTGFVQHSKSPRRITNCSHLSEKDPRGRFVGFAVCAHVWNHSSTVVSYRSSSHSSVSSPHLSHHVSSHNYLIASLISSPLNHAAIFNFQSRAIGELIFEASLKTASRKEEDRWAKGSVLRKEKNHSTSPLPESTGTSWRQFITIGPRSQRSDHSRCNQQSSSHLQVQ